MISVGYMKPLLSFLPSSLSFIPHVGLFSNIQACSGHHSISTTTSDHSLIHDILTSTARIQNTFKHIGAHSKHGLTRVATSSTYLFNSIVRLAISLPTTAKSVCKAAMLRIHGSLSSTSTHFINCVVRITAPAIALTSAGYNACKAAMLQANKSVATTWTEIINFVVRNTASAIASTSAEYNAYKAAVLQSHVVTTSIHFIRFITAPIVEPVQTVFNAFHHDDSIHPSSPSNRKVKQNGGGMHGPGGKDACTGGDGDMTNSWVLVKDVKACSVVFAHRDSCVGCEHGDGYAGVWEQVARDNRWHGEVVLEEARSTCWRRLLNHADQSKAVQTSLCDRHYEIHGSLPSTCASASFFQPWHNRPGPTYSTEASLSRTSSTNPRSARSSAILLQASGSATTTCLSTIRTKMTRSGHSEEIDLALAFGSAVSRTEESTSDFVDWQTEKLLIDSPQYTPQTQNSLPTPSWRKSIQVKEPTSEEIMSDDEGSIGDEDDMYISEDYFGMRIDGGRPATGLAKEAKTLLGKNSTSVPAKEQKRKVVPKSITGLDNTSPTTTNLSGENTNLSGRYRNTDDTLIEVQRSELPAEIVQQVEQFLAPVAERPGLA
ncbi:uncharacterized protein MYCGRDRAFT_97746 [Zymoseptoria tritici IPO323]|uniref:Uncharacterized protein n=1 Tax=Zymoseptoria tritici (strain CBS 115943 / IPO323) TaxID=336722 RepID=F9XR87_ZYMTI|nr:uncharacterized protein MYCGRDRAFT_97746 [Zymoseptoria tritici IPO323]EGP82254.1 hypothetical protein MYCGRDRAFT_97746 [Zymoseptoria tritici IPO323]